MSDSRPIGVFDSGIGGLTVVREIMAGVPYESIVYFGDIARVPYGTKSAKAIRSFACQDTRFLLKHDVKMVVVACNTASSVALDELTDRFLLPIIGVIEPSVDAALKATLNNRIGIIGTTGTVLSGSYQRKLSERKNGLTVVSQACPLFVPLVEEGWFDGDVTQRIASVYLKTFLKKKIDTLILGCTHYPLLKPVIKEYFGREVRLIDPAEETARVIGNCLREKGIETTKSKPVKHRFYVSDIPHHFRKIGEQCLGRRLESVTRITLDAIESVDR